MSRSVVEWCIVILWGLFSLDALLSWNWHDILAYTVCAGILLFMWQSIRALLREILGLVPPREHNELHLHQHVHEDPTRPDEDYPAVIEISRHRRKR